MNHALSPGIVVSRSDAPTPVREASKARRLAEALYAEVQTLERRNVELNDRVRVLSAPVEESNETPSSIDRWLADLEREIERLRDQSRSEGRTADAERLAALSNFVGYVMHGGGQAAMTERESRDAGTHDRPPESRAGPPLEPVVRPQQVDPASVLSGPTASAPPHRVVFTERRPIPGMEGVRYRTRKPYRVGWLDRNAPWLVSGLIALDFTDRFAAVARGLEPISRGFGTMLDPMARAVDRLSAALQRMVDSATTGIEKALAVAPMPRALKEWLWLVPRRDSAEREPVRIATRRQAASMVWLGLIGSTFAHFALFAFWPTLEAEDFSFVSEELTAIEVPPEVEIPPPPQQMSRPATPVISSDPTISEDVTIDATTFEANPVEELPPPPEAAPEDDSAPTFTPFTVAPRIVNGDDLADLMHREYPPSLREAGIGGTVVVWFFVDEGGAVQDTRLFQTSGYDQLDRAGLRVAEAFQFTPALDGDRQVAVWIQLPLTFQVR